MDHSYYRDRISAYFDNELPPQEREVVEQHIRECAECRNLLAELQKLDRLVEQRSQLGGEEYWEQSAQKIEQRLGFTGETKVTDITPSRWMGLAPKLVAVAASIAILAFIALYEGDISREVYAPAMKSTEVQQVAPGKKQPPPPSEGHTYQEGTSADKKAGATTPVPRSEEETRLSKAYDAEALPVKKDQAVATEETPPKVREKKEPSEQKITISVPEKINDPSQQDSELTGVKWSRESALSAGKADSFAEPQVVDEFAEIPRVQTQAAVSAGKGVSVIVSPASLPDGWLQPVSLEKWRHRRDSLQTLYAHVTSIHLPLSASKSRQQVELPPPEQVEELLLHTYYQVARLTEDEEERAAAIGYITDYAQKAESHYKDQAQEYLEELRYKQE